MADGPAPGLSASTSVSHLGFCVFCQVGSMGVYGRALVCAAAGFERVTWASASACMSVCCSSSLLLKLAYCAVHYASSAHYSALHRNLFFTTRCVVVLQRVVRVHECVAWCFFSNRVAAWVHRLAVYSLFVPGVMSSRHSVCLGVLCGIHKGLSAARLCMHTAGLCVWSHMRRVAFTGYQYPHMCQRSSVRQVLPQVVGWCGDCAACVLRSVKFAVCGHRGCEVLGCACARTYNTQSGNSSQYTSGCRAAVPGLLCQHWPPDNASKAAIWAPKLCVLRRMCRASRLWSQASHRPVDAPSAADSCAGWWAVGCHGADPMVHTSLWGYVAHASMSRCVGHQPTARCVGLSSCNGATPQQGLTLRRTCAERWCQRVQALHWYHFVWYIGTIRITLWWFNYVTRCLACIRPAYLPFSLRAHFNVGAVAEAALRQGGCCVCVQGVDDGCEFHGGWGCVSGSFEVQKVKGMSCHHVTGYGLTNVQLSRAFVVKLPLAAGGGTPSTCCLRNNHRRSCCCCCWRLQVWVASTHLHCTPSTTACMYGDARLCLGWLTRAMLLEAVCDTHTLLSPALAVDWVLGDRLAAATAHL
jgi:hypothetical protein